MTRSQFTTLTGFEPTYEEWVNILEKAKAYESIESYIEVFNNQKQDIIFYKERANVIQELKKKISWLQFELDQELEWTNSSIYGTHLSLNQVHLIDDMIDRARNIIDDEAAGKYLVENFGYDVTRLAFPHSTNRYQINKYRRSRLYSVRRLPNVVSKDIIYIRFDILAGEKKDHYIPYELIDGKFICLWNLQKVPNQLSKDVAK